MRQKKTGHGRSAFFGADAVRTCELVRFCGFHASYNVVSAVLTCLPALHVQCVGQDLPGYLFPMTPSETSCRLFKNTVKSKVNRQSHTLQCGNFSFWATALRDSRNNNAGPDGVTDLLPSRMRGKCRELQRRRPAVHRDGGCALNQRPTAMRCTRLSPYTTPLCTAPRALILLPGVFTQVGALPPPRRRRRGRPRGARHGERRAARGQGAVPRPARARGAARGATR